MVFPIRLICSSLCPGQPAVAEAIPTRACKAEAARPLMSTVMATFRHVRESVEQPKRVHRQSSLPLNVVHLRRIKHSALAIPGRSIHSMTLFESVRCGSELLWPRLLPLFGPSTTAHYASRHHQDGCQSGTGFKCRRPLPTSRSFSPDFVHFLFVNEQQHTNHNGQGMLSGRQRRRGKPLRTLASLFTTCPPRSTSLTCLPRLMPL